MSERAALAGRRVIVTGGAQGLGREFALHLAALGAHVLAADIEAESLRETSELAEERGTPILTCPTDVSDSGADGGAGASRRGARWAGSTRWSTTRRSSRG